jgi:predicted metal-binding membrane protein
MAGHGHAMSGDSAFWTLSLMWFAMMAAMMAPTAWPWVHAYHRFGGTRGSTAMGPTIRFAAGYLLAWLGYAVGAASLQRLLQAAALMQPSGDVVIAPLGAAVFVATGLYQFAPLKRACLTHCRTPFGYFLKRWFDGPIGALRLGLHHGLFCVGCCLALMATAFAVGVMNTWWMAVVAAAALIEQTAPHGERLRRAMGAAFVVAGILQVIA